MAKYFILNIVLSCSLIFSNIIKPSYGDTLNYIDVLVGWNQVQDAGSYRLEVFNDEDSLIYSVIDSSLNVVLSDNFDWSGSYYINLFAIKNDSSNEILIESDHIFYTASLPEVEILPFTTNIINESQYYAGYNFIDYLVIDKYSKVIFFTPQVNNARFGFMNQLDNGYLLGIGYGSIGGVIIDLDGNFIYQTSSEIGDVHHDFQPMGNGNFLGLVRGSVIAEIPNGAWDNQLQENGIFNLRWQYDDIVEFDNLGNEVWRWSTNDYFSKQDFNENWFNVSQAINNSNGSTPKFDWTHCNAIFYDGNESVIYLSCRHLSRIIKIGYPEGNIIWMIGEDMPSGEVYLGDEIDISSQHAIKVLNNGNLMLFDNGNYNDPVLSRCLEFQIENDGNEFIFNKIWEHVLPVEYYSSKLGDCDRLPNGNSLLASGAIGYSLEVNQNNDLIWENISNFEDHGSGNFPAYSSFYRAERIDGLYPLIFSVTIDNFKDSLGVKYIYIPTGESYFKFSIENEGDKNYKYQYNISDNLGLVEYYGETNIIENEKLEIVIPITVSESMVNNIIQISVMPVTVHTANEILINLNANACTTNPNYNFSDMSECLPYENMCDAELGDVTNDGNINILDIVQIINLIFHISILEFECAADFNSDGQINILDLVEISNIIIR